MTDSSAVLPRGWRYGMHPKAVGTQIRSLGRVELPLGQALRLEMAASHDLGGGEETYVQYYICTESGGWGLWTSGPPTDVADREAALLELVPPSEGAP